MLKSSSALRRFFAAHLQSQLGSGAGYVALVLIAYQRLHSGWAIALVLLADFLPGTVLAAPFGALADRLPRMRLAVVADLLRAAAFIGLAVVPSIGATLVLALAAGVGSALFRPAVAEGMLGRVFGLQGMLTDIAYVVAFLSSGLLLTTLGVRSVFALGGSLLLALTIAGWLGFHPSRPAETFPAALPETG